MTALRLQRPPSSIALVLAVLLGTPSALAQPKQPHAPAAAPPVAATPATPATPPAGLADSLTGPAKDDYMAARLLFGDRDYASALVKFESAYTRSKDPRLLFNMGACEKNLRHYAKTIGYFERYKAEASATFTQADRDEVDKYLDELRPFVSPMRVTSNEVGAQVFIDDVLVGTTPLASATRVDIGQRRVKVTKEGFGDFTTTTVVSGAGEVAVDAHLEKVVHAGRLIVTAGDKDAITLDDQPIATGHFDGSLPSGGHQLQVSAKGMTTYQSEVIILDQQTRTLDIHLVPAPGPTVPTWAWIAGSAAVVVAGCVVGGVFLFKSSPAGPTTVGTIDPGVVTISSLRHAR